ncbi:MAG: hypothetical protein AAF203_06060, partial [Pseudomonadota bacterium]
MSNWMVQLAILFIVIFGVVAWDSLSGKPAPRSNGSLPPVSSSIQRDQSNLGNEDSTESFTIETTQEMPSTEQTEVTEAQAQPQIEEPSFIRNLKKKVSIKVMSMGRGAIEQLTQIAQKVDEGAYVVSRQQGVNFLKENRKAIRGFSRASRSQYEFGEVTELFMGEQDDVTGVSLGFFVQVTVSENSTPENINAEVRFWHQLKLADEPSPALTYIVNLKNQDGFYLIDSAVHDMEFTPEETALFESSNKLNGLNNENFIENLSDIAVLIEIK